MSASQVTTDEVAAAAHLPHDRDKIKWRHDDGAPLPQSEE